MSEAPPATDQYDNKGCSTQHRRATEVLLATPEGEPIVTFCPYAGKPGRPRPENNHNKAVSHAILSGTVLWLVCPLVNNAIARIERTGGVRLIDARLKTDAFLGPLQEASHRVYESYVTQTLLKDPEEQQRFLKMFVQVDAGEEKEGHKRGNYNRKYGNAGVSAPRDLKCFHAVAAQALGGAANPVGCVVVLYLFFLNDKLDEMEAAERAEAEAAATTEGEEVPPAAAVAEASPAVASAEATANPSEATAEKPKPDPGAPSRRVFAEKKTAFAAFVDDFGNFEAFLNDCIAHQRLTIDEATMARLPQLTAMSKRILHALEGHQPYQRKKRRIH